MSKYLLPCTCSSAGCTNDLLSCAPCPPPKLPYAFFRDYALNQSLSITQVCSIAKRCMPLEPGLAVDCSIGETDERAAYMTITIIISLGVTIILICLYRWQVISRTGRRKKKTPDIHRTGMFSNRIPLVKSRHTERNKEHITVGIYNLKQQFENFLARNSCPCCTGTHDNNMKGKLE